MSWDTVFLPSTSLWELFGRSTVLYLSVLILMRVAGRKQTGQLNTGDIILIVIISEAASVGIGGETHSITDGLVLVATIIFWNVVIDMLGYHFSFIERLIQPKPTLVVSKGEPQVQAMKKQLLTMNELSLQLRIQGIEDVGKVYRAYLEPDGQISVIPWP